MANKKINQLVLKTTIQSTDLFPLGDPTTGQLFKKTVAELQAAIGGAVISVNGLVGTVVLDTDDIQELASPTNRYFTEARARAAISLTTTGNSGASTYSNSTGVLNVPTYTLAGLGGITASFLSGGTGITYNSSTGVIAYSGTVYTDASIRALFSAGTGISYNSSTGAISYSGTVYTDSSIRALISLTTSGSSGASTYNNTTGVLNVPTYTLAGLGGISLTSLSGSAPITYNSSTGAIGITQASTSADGYLSSIDWNTFNGKQSALTLGNLTEATSSILTITGGTGAVIGSGTSIQVKQASSTVSGFLSSTDWSTFNSKQGTITLTTTGTSGAATFSGGTLNIPQYQAVLTNPVTGTGTTNYVTKWTSSSAIGNSTLQEVSGNLGLGVTPSSFSGFTVLEMQGGSIGSSGTGTLRLLHNVFYNGSNWIYKNSAASSRYELDGNTFIWYNTPSGTAGATATFTQRMTLDANGRLGIGTTSPVATLSMPVSTTNSQISTGSLEIQSYALNNSWIGDNIYYNGSSFVARNTGFVHQIYFESSSGIRFNTGGSSISAGAASNATEKMRITTTGLVGIGTSEPLYRLTVRGTVSKNSTSYNAPFAIFTDEPFSSNPFGVNFGIIGSTSQASRRVTIQTTEYGLSNDGLLALQESGGNVLIGTGTNNGERLYVSGSIRATGSITANSDARLKKNIERIENALEKVGQISGYTYNTIYDEDRHAGVIAQEIDKVLPEIVNKGNDGLMGVEYGNISALLIEAIKEQKVLIESLQAKVEALSK